MTQNMLSCVFLLLEMHPWSHFYSIIELVKDDGSAFIGFSLKNY